MTDSAAKRWLDFAGIQNLRDIGGYATRSGRTTRYKRLLRSGNLDKVPTESQQQLIDYGVKHIIDIRDEWEQANYRNVFTEHATVTYANVPFIGNAHLKDAESERFMADAEKRSDVYTFVLENCQQQIARIVQSIAALPENECSVIHCVAGKDRTGMVVALILGALDVPAETIAQEYALSSVITAHLLSLWQSENDDEQKRQKLAEEASATVATMHEVFAWLDAQYGGANGYLQAAGVEGKMLSQLQRRLLE